MPQVAPSFDAVSPHHALGELWESVGLRPEALQRVAFKGAASGFPSSFAVDVAAQASIGAAALIATEIDALRKPTSPAQSVAIDAQHALAETTGYFTLDGVRPSVWSPISGLYECGGDVGQPGHVRIHANFAHHRDGALRLLGLPAGEVTTKAQVATALRRWNAVDFETQATLAGLVVAAVRTAQQWETSEMQRAIAVQPLVRITQLDKDHPAAPCAWPAISAQQQPLAGLKVLDLTRILAGPVSTRTLAAYGADVLMINSPHLPNIESIADVSRGKRSALLDLKTDAGRAQMQRLLGDAQVFIQGYRPGGLERLGLGVKDVARVRPGIVYGSLSAYGREGPWADKRGFDSLVQTVSGINMEEAEAFGDSQPRALPMQMLDYSAGFLLAFGVQVALLRQATEGGTWHVEVSLARVAQWLKALGCKSVAAQAAAGKVEELVSPWLQSDESGFGALRAVSHSAEFSGTKAGWSYKSVPPGTDAPVWK